MCVYVCSEYSYKYTYMFYVDVHVYMYIQAAAKLCVWVTTVLFERLQARYLVKPQCCIASVDKMIFSYIGPVYLAVKWGPGVT